MSISFVAEGIPKPKLQYRYVSVWLKQIIGQYNCLIGNLTYIFCNDEYLKSINIKYLNHDYYTDIVTFDYCSSGIISGDMFISVDRVSENSVIFKNSLEEELLRVIVHGVLHLLGYGDSCEAENEKMRQKEDEFIFLFKEISDGHIK